VLAFWAINLPHLLFHRMSIARSWSVPTGYANKSPQEAPYETLTYANGPGFNTHRALNLSDCAKGLWREIPEEERRQARWECHNNNNNKYYYYSNRGLEDTAQCGVRVEVRNIVTIVRWASCRSTHGQGKCSRPVLTCQHQQTLVFSKCPDRLSSPNVLFSGYWGLIPRGKTVGA